MAEPPSAPSKLSRLGRFELLSELGKGAMGVVYLAKDPAIGRLVAIKTIRPAEAGEDDSESREFRERFLREAQTAGILSHPNIVTIYDVGEDKETGVSFIAMEYIEGKTIKALISEKARFTPDQVADIIGQVAEALDYAHRKGIIHRDIKPANIMITTDGKVKITDFGIAKIASSNLTTTGQFLGTPNYMSPEQITGAPVDGRSDIFSLSVVLYEMLSRRKPFSGENLTTISYKIVHESFTPVQDISKTVPEEFDTILGRGLAKDPWNRFQRGKDMALALYQAKARFEERAIFSDLGAMVSSAENIPTLKLEDPARSAPTAPESEGSEATVAMPTPAEALDSAPVPAGGPSMGPAESVEAAPAGTEEPPAGPAGKRRKLPWVPAAIAVAAAAGIVALVIRRAPPPALPASGSAETQAAHQIQQDVDRAKALYDRGDYAASLEIFHSVLQRDPSVVEARNYSQLAEQALVSQQARQAEAEKQTSVAEHLAAARTALERRDYETAIAEADQVSDLDPQNPDAARISETARKRLGISKRAELQRRREKRRSAGAPRRVAESRGAAAPSASPAQAASPGAPAVTANTPASIRISFDSPIPKGFLMVAVGERIIFRKNFDFGKGGRGLVSDTIHTAPGSTTVKVWLTTPNPSVKGYVPIPTTLAPGDHRTLTVTLQGGRLSAHLP